MKTACYGSPSSRLTGGTATDGAVNNSTICRQNHRKACRCAIIMTV